MCDCQLPVGAMCVRNKCQQERADRIAAAHAGPSYDPRRQAGRTSEAVKQAVLAAAFGKRVVYLCAHQASADHARTVAQDFLVKSFGDLTNAEGLLYNRVSVSKDRITFYFNNGIMSGMLVFRSIAAQDINIGQQGNFKFHVIEDHFVVELREERARQEGRLADSNEIKRLMRKNGWAKATDCLADLANPRTDKLVFRT